MERQPAQARGRGIEEAAEERHVRHARRVRMLVQHADLPAVAEVRTALRDFLRHWGVPALADTAELLTSELVTNALQHTDSGAVLTATLTGRPAQTQRLRVEVRDQAAGQPSMRDPADHTTSGRGLFLVQALADAWGVHAEGPGKVVWFELTVDTA